MPLTEEQLDWLVAYARQQLADETFVEVAGLPGLDQGALLGAYRAVDALAAKLEAIGARA